jgi:sec-independent protein translocase protein TatB
MFDFSFGELSLVALVAILVVGPKDLPKVMRAIGRWVGKFRGISDEFRAGMHSAMREMEMHGLQEDAKQVIEDVKYIRDDAGNLQPVYDISDFLDERERARIKLAHGGEAIEKKDAP